MPPGPAGSASSRSRSWCPSGPPAHGSRPRDSLVRIERAEVALDEVLDRQRHVAPVESRQGVAIEVGVDLPVADVRTGVHAGARLVALVALAGAAGTGDVRRVARATEAVERGEDVGQVPAELRRPVRIDRSAEGAGGA